MEMRSAVEQYAGLIKVFRVQGDKVSDYTHVTFSDKSGVLPDLTIKCDPNGVDGEKLTMAQVADRLEMWGKGELVPSEAIVGGQSALKLAGSWVKRDAE